MTSKIIAFLFLIFCSSIFGQNFQLSLKNGNQLDSKTFEFDVFIKAVSPTVSFTLVAYQVAMSFNSAISNNGELSFIYVNSSSNLLNEPSASFGISNTDGAPELFFASYLGEDLIESSDIKVGTFQIINSKEFASEMIDIKFDFIDNNTVILLGSDFTNITESGMYKDLDYLIPLEPIILDFELNIKVFLEGPYADGSTTNPPMSSKLTQHIPLSQPFNAAPWFYSKVESVGAIPNGVVDWVLLELLSDKTTVIYRKAAFIKNDGYIVNIDGNPLKIKGIPGLYYIVVHHKNHLSIMSAGRINL